MCDGTQESLWAARRTDRVVVTAFAAGQGGAA
jgi:hypothetical protein